MQQMVVEGSHLELRGGSAGNRIGPGSVRLLAHELSQTLPVPVPAAPDGWMLLTLLSMTIVSALLATAWPAFLAVRVPIEPALKQGGMQSGAGRRQHRMRSALVAVEIAMSLTLLAVCGLLLRSVYALRQVPLGFRTDHILVANLSIPSYRFAGQNMTERLYQPLLEHAQRLHGVESAGLMSRSTAWEYLRASSAVADERIQDRRLHEGGKSGNTKGLWVPHGGGAILRAGGYRDLRAGDHREPGIRPPILTQRTRSKSHSGSEAVKPEKGCAHAGGGRG